MKNLLTSLLLSSLLLLGLTGPASGAPGSHIRVGDCWISNAEAYCDGKDISGLKDRAGVTYVSVVSHTEDLSVLESMPDLDKLWVFYEATTIAQSPPLPPELVDSIVKTKITELGIMPPVTDLSPFASMTQLRVLDISASDYGNGGASLTALNKLETFRVSGGHGTDLSPWGKSPSLKELEFKLISKPITAKVGTEFTFPSFTWLDGQDFQFETDWEYSTKRVGPNTFKAIKPYYVHFMDPQMGIFTTPSRNVSWRVYPGEAAMLLTTDQMAWAEPPKLSVSPSYSFGVKPVNKTLPVNTELYFWGSTKYPGDLAKQTCEWFRNGKSTGNRTCWYRLGTADSNADIELRVVQTPTTEARQYLTPLTTTLKANYAVWQQFKHKAKITGSVKVGSTLKATPSNAPSGTSYSYQWLREGKTIGSATKATYKLAASDLSKRISVQVTAKKSGYYPTLITTAQTAKVGKGALAMKTHPTVSGSLKVGQTLNSKPGTWSATPDRYTYQWYRSGAAINKATKSTYKMTSRDKGKVMYVKVTAHKAGYTSKSANSKVR